MDRLGFFKQGLSSMLDVASSIVGLKHAANSFVEVVDDALSNIKTDIGLHLPSLEAGMYDDPEGTLSGVANIGYSMVEVGSYFGDKVLDMAPDKLKAMTDKFGLKITSAHLNHLYEAPATEEVAPTEDVVQEDTKDVAQDGTGDNTKEGAEVIAQKEEKLDPNDEWWCKALDIHKKLGCRYIVMSRLPDYPTEEVVAEYATYFNRIGELAAERGMQFCYHPRQQEFKAADGTSPFEVIAANTDPKKVHFEIDTYEAAEAGVDVNELLKRLTKRITLLHIRDYGIVGESEKIDFEKIIAEGIRTGVKDIFVEVRNFSLPPMNCVERSFYNVESLPSISY